MLLILQLQQVGTDLDVAIQGKEQLFDGSSVLG